MSTNNKTAAKLKVAAKVVGGVGEISQGVPSAQHEGAGIKVCVRVRPFIKEEVEGDRSGGKTECCIEMPTKTCTIMRRDDEERVFEYDRCYWSHSKYHPLFATQQTLQEELGETMLTHAMNGFNNCIFAYGQTGSGKSYSVLGGPGEDRGLLPRIVEGLFERFKAMPADMKKKTLVSFMEIYNEEIHDLLAVDDMKSSKGGKLDMRLHPTLGLTIPGLQESPVESCESVMKLVEIGQENRMTSATAMNATSSRSHCIFTFKTSLAELDGATKMSQTHLVDLAGSERAGRTKAEGDRLKEGAAINKSLSTLARVISELAKAGGKKSNPPFRDSKLTYVLKESLCGNSKTVMMAAISPNVIDFEETLSTMKFCQQVKKVQTKAVANTGNEKGIEAMLRQEAEALRAKLAHYEEIAQGGPLMVADPQSTTAAEWNEIEAQHGRQTLIKQKLEQLDQLSRFYGKDWETLIAEEEKRNKKRAHIPALDEIQIKQLQEHHEQVAASSADEQHTDSDSDETETFVLCYCVTKPAAMPVQRQRSTDGMFTGNIMEGVSLAFTKAPSDTSQISVIGPIARELRASLEMEENGLETMERMAESKTDELAHCWKLCFEAEHAVAALSVPTVPKLELIPHVAIKPDEIELDCQVLVSVECKDDPNVPKEWLRPDDLERRVRWLRSKLEAESLDYDQHGSDENAWETCTLEHGLPTLREMNSMRVQLSACPRMSLVQSLKMQSESRSAELAEAREQAENVETLNSELLQERSEGRRLRVEALELSSIQENLTIESEELQKVRKRAEQLEPLREVASQMKVLESTAASQSAGLDMQRKELAAARSEAVEARRLRAEALALRAELDAAEDALRERERRQKEEARELHRRLSEAEGQLSFAESQVEQADELMADYQRTKGQLRILQGQGAEAERLREELDLAQDRLAEVSCQLSEQQQQLELEQHGDELEQLQAKLGATEAELRLESRRAEDAERLRAALAVNADELREAQDRASQADRLTAEFGAMQQSLRDHKSKVEEGNRIRGEFQAAEQELNVGRAAVKEADRLRGELAKAQRELSDAQKGLASKAAAAALGAEASEAELRAAASAAETTRLRQELTTARGTTELVEQLRHEVAAAREHHLEERRDKDDVAAQADQLRSELGALQAELYGQRRRVSNAEHLRTTNNALQTELTEKHNQLNELEAEMAARAVPSKSSSARADTSASDSFRAELESCKSEARMEADRLRAQISQALEKAAQADALEGRLAVLQSSSQENCRLHSEVAAMQYQVEAAHQSAGAADALRAQLQATRRELATALAQLPPPCAIGQGPPERAPSPSAAEDALQAEAGGLRSELARTRGQLAASQEELAQLSPQAAQLRGDFARVQAQLDAAQGQLSASQPQTAQLRAELVATQAELDATRQQLSASQPQTAQLRAELAATQAELDATRQQLSASQPQTAQLRAELAATQAHLDAMKQQLRASQPQTAQFRAELAATRAQLEAAQRQLGASQPQTAQLRAELAATRAQLELAQRQLGASQPQTAQLRAELAATQAELDATQRQLTASQPQTDQFCAELAAVQGQLGSVREQLAMQRATAQAHTAASSMLLAASTGGARPHDLASIIASSFEAAIDTIETAKQELIMEGAARGP